MESIHHQYFGSNRNSLSKKYVEMNKNLQIWPWEIDYKLDGIKKAMAKLVVNFK